MITSISGGFNSADLETIRQNRLKKADADGDGKLTKAELSSVLPQNGKGPSVDEVFTRVDTNQDGVIDETEDKEAFKNMRPAGPPPGAPPSAEKLAAKIFKSLDADSSGSISKEELTSSLSNSSSGIKADDLFKLLDGDSDGSITQTELKDTLKKLFELMKSGTDDNQASGNQTYSKSGTSSSASTDGCFSATA